MRKGTTIAILAVAAVGLALAGCSDDDDVTPADAGTADASALVDAAPDAAVDYPIHEPVAPWNACSAEDEPPEATVVTVHDQADQYWIGWDPGQNLRVVDASALAPAGGPWRRVFLKVELDCPADGQCDWWDRSAAISVVRDAGTVDEQPIELARHMTPYRVGMCFVLDVTDFASLLTGTVTLRSFIDTWVGPGHSQGHGWRVTTRLVYHPGTPAGGGFADEVIPLWNNNAEDRLVNLGDPGDPYPAQLEPRTVTIPADAARVELQWLVTGHGQGNLDNCAEFCNLTHRVAFGGQQASFTPWRSDCADNPVDTQSGTWQYDRAGWCPGAWVPPEVIDITADVTPGAEVTFDYVITDFYGAEYVNTCRPGAGDGDNLCTGCAFDANPGNCDYDWSMHTPAYGRISAQLLIHR